MKKSLATETQVVKALKNIFKKQKVVPSQHKLKMLVDSYLKTKKTVRLVSEQRLRNIAVRSGFIKLEIHSRDGDPERVLTKCPVCGSVLKRVKNLTIWGGEVTIEFRCPVCGYWTGKKKRIPTRYVFHLKT
ncbi:MAG: hypothetical protein J7L32_06305 [Thermoplasmata archaeon]|nr:MAG: hypothetical protein FE035_01265 [Thermoplasmata archaeon]MCD6468897.1 hypothetical protein [Thermoplasmata archaeon]RLF27929.1 MAG: hypothetical protein DRN01_01135 [Thermoplasmata archaeon]